MARYLNVAGAQKTVAKYLMQERLMQHLGGCVCKCACAWSYNPAAHWQPWQPTRQTALHMQPVPQDWGGAARPGKATPCEVGRALNRSALHTWPQQDNKQGSMLHELEQSTPGPGHQLETP